MFETDAEFQEWELRVCHMEASHRAVTHRMDILDRLYYSVRIQPWTGKLVRICWE